MSKITAAYYSSPIGTIEVQETDSIITAIHFVEQTDDSSVSTASATTAEAIQQLDEYFNGKRTGFDFSYKGQGTLFQQKVWTELENISYGKTATYKDIAAALQDEKLVRAVGNANGKNPLAIVVPCHRIIGTGGKLTGYAGGLWRKQWLLEHEQKNSGSQLYLFG